MSYRCRSVFLFRQLTCDIYTTCGGVRQGVGDTTAVTDDVESVVTGHEVFIDLDLHVVELNLDTVEQGVVIGGTRCDLVEGVDHLDDAVEDTLWEYEAQITGSCVQGRYSERLPDTLLGTPLTTDEITEALHDDTAAEHVAETRDALTIFVRILERLGEVLRHEQCEVRVLRLLRGILIAVAVYGDDAVGVFIDHGTLRIHTEGADVILILFGTVNDLTLVELVGEIGENFGRQLDTYAEVYTV